MSTSPRKHRAPFRPVDTILSPQKPHFKTPSVGSKYKRAVHSLPDNEGDSYLSESESGYSTGSFTRDRSETEFLGNSSSLFEEDRSQPQLHTPPSALHFQHVNAHNKDNVGRLGNMVREREPPAAHARPQAPAAKPLQELVNKPSAKPSQEGCTKGILQSLV
jgi:hypothetical protein